MKALGRRSVATIVRVVLEIAWVILWLGAAGVALATIAFAGLMIAAAAGALPAEMVSGDLVVMDEGEKLDWRLIVPALLAAAVAVAGALIVVRSLKRLFANFTSGEPFSADNARHLRVIWITLLVVEISRWAVLGLFGIILITFGQPRMQGEWSLDIDFNLMTWAMILILIVLAEVFREGARLREEQELTI